MGKGYLEARYPVTVVPREGIQIENMLDIPHTVDMAVEVYIAVTHRIRQHLLLGLDFYVRKRLYGTRAVEHKPSEVLQPAHIGRTAGCKVEHYPYRARKAEGTALAIYQLEVTRREVLVVTLYPRKQCIILINGREAFHLYRQPRQHPSQVMLYQFGITHIPRLGMQRSHLYDTSCQERQRHLLLAVTLARRETKCFAENFFLHPFKSSNTFTRCFSACKSSTKTAMREKHYIAISILIRISKQ